MEIKLNISMLLPFPRYGENIRVPPQIGICSYLTRFGHNVTWILWSDCELKGQPLTLNGIEIMATTNRSVLPARYLFFRIFNRILNSITRMNATIESFRDNKYNIIFVRDDVLDGMIGYYIKKKFDVPFIFALSNPLEQSLEYTKIVRGNPNIILNLLLKSNICLAKWLLRKADLIIPISKWLEDDLVRKGIPPEKIMPVPEGIDPEIFRDQDCTDVCEKYPLGESNVIIYVGTLGKGRHLEVLIKAFSDIRKMTSNVKLLMVGEGDGREDLEKICCELGMGDDVIFTGEIPMSDVPSYISASDIGISPVPPYSFYKMSSPIKMFEYMAMGIPVIANEEIPEQKEVLEESRGGILVPFTSEGFSDAITELLSNPNECSYMGQRGKDWVIKNRNYDILARKVEEKYIELAVIFDKDKKEVQR